MPEKKPVIDSDPLWKQNQLKRLQEKKILPSPEMGQVEELKKKRSSSKRNVTLQVNIVDPLLDLKGQEAVDGEPRIRQALQILDKRFEAFTDAHEAYVAELENVTEEEDLDSLDEEQKYFTEVSDSYYNVLKKVKLYDAEVKTVNDKVKADADAAEEKVKTNADTERRKAKADADAAEEKAKADKIEQDLKEAEVRKAKETLLNAVEDHERVVHNVTVIHNEVKDLLANEDNLTED